MQCRPWQQRPVFEWQPVNIWGAWRCLVGRWSGHVNRSIVPAGWRATVTTPTQILHAERLFEFQSAAEAWVEQMLARLQQQERVVNESVMSG